MKKAFVLLASVMSVSSALAFPTKYGELTSRDDGIYLDGSRLKGTKGATIEKKDIYEGCGKTFAVATKEGPFGITEYAVVRVIHSDVLKKTKFMKIRKTVSMSGDIPHNLSCEEKGSVAYIRYEIDGETIRKRLEPIPVDMEAGRWH